VTHYTTGQKIRFRRDIDQPASEDGPAGLLAEQGEVGEYVCFALGDHASARQWPHKVNNRDGHTLRVADSEIEAVATYSVKTYDLEISEYTPQDNEHRWTGLMLGELRSALKRLRGLGYLCHRRGNRIVGHYDNDSNVLVKRET